MDENISFIDGSNKSDDSNPMNYDNENDGKYGRKSVKVHQSKNLEAERKRRKKLNDRLYTLRALVPNISKLDRTAILGDAINYVKELQKQVNDLQLELEQDSDDDENVGIISRENICRKLHEDKYVVNGFHEGSSYKYDELQQMEPQVEVFQLEGNEYFVKVLCEHKAGRFMQLIEALNTLGFKIINVNASRHTCLVSNVFTLERTEKEAIPVDHLKESLLELARNPFDGIL